MNVGVTIISNFYSAAVRLAGLPPSLLFAPEALSKTHGIV